MTKTKSKPKKELQVWTEAERQAWRIQKAVKVSDFSDENRIIGHYSAEPGPWRTDRAPYLRDIMDAYVGTDVKEITIMGPAQCGKSEAVFNMIAYTVAVDPVQSMYVIARDEDCDDISDERLRPMFEEAPALAKHLTGKPWDMKKDKFKFDRMALYFTGARSAPALTSKPIGRLFLDETDKYKQHVGNEGSPASLAKRRTTTFGDVKIVYICTPTTIDGFIWQSYNRSNMQRYYVPCSQCSEYFSFSFANLKPDPPDCRDPDYILDNECVYYQCPHCKERIYQYQQSDMVAAGLWVPEGQKPNAEGRLAGKPKRGPRHTGFWISPFLSPWINWAEMLAEFFEANRDKQFDPGKLREFVNQTLAQTHEEAGQKPDEDEIKKQRGDFSRGTVPPECLMLVAGVDYHEDEKGIKTIYYEIRGFGYLMQNRMVHSGVVTDWDDLDNEILMSPFPWADGTPNEKKPFLAVTLVFVDSGFKPEEVYSYCIKRPGLTFATEGSPVPRAAPLTLTKLERTSQKTKRYKGITRFIVDTCYFKDQVTSWAQQPKDKDGNIAGSALTKFYAETPDYYFRQFANEHKVKVKSGHREIWMWQPVYKGAPCHSLDTAVLCAAAGFHKGVHYLRPPGYKKPAAAAGQKRKTQPPKRPTQSGFLDNLPKL